MMVISWQRGDLMIAVTMRWCLSLLCFLFAVSIFQATRAQDRVEAFAGYSFERVPVQIVGGGVIFTTGTSNTNLNGWEGTLVYKPAKWIGLAADFGGHYGSLSRATVHQHTYLFGPQLSFPGRVSPFVHVLVGGAHQSATGGIFPTGAFPVTTGDSFASAMGGGIDIKALPFVAIRVIQVDYVLTRFNGQTQNQPRVSAGVVFHF
jgi:hypothetical protein